MRWLAYPLALSMLFAEPVYSAQQRPKLVPSDREYAAACEAEYKNPASTEATMNMVSAIGEVSRIGTSMETKEQKFAGMMKIGEKYGECASMAAVGTVTKNYGTVYKRLGMSPPVIRGSYKDRAAAFVGQEKVFTLLQRDRERNVESSRRARERIAAEEARPKISVNNMIITINEFPPSYALDLKFTASHVSGSLVPTFNKDLQEGIVLVGQKYDGGSHIPTKAIRQERGDFVAFDKDGCKFLSYGREALVNYIEYANNLPRRKMRDVMNFSKFTEVLSEKLGMEWYGDVRIRADRDGPDGSLDYMSYRLRAQSSSKNVAIGMYHTGHLYSSDWLGKDFIERGLSFFRRSFRVWPGFGGIMQEMVMYGSRDGRHGNYGNFNYVPADIGREIFVIVEEK
ncbi:MAG TPA: hypothetical protein VJI12_01255 [archaeon]|nr:hypothetical protein [archaeon]